MAKIVVLHAESTYTGPFWDENGAEAGDCNSFEIDGTYYKVNLPGFKEWYSQADKYDPYSDLADFQLAGFEEWVNKG